jgi:MerR family transcriptional regulator/heat shock protein HspR
MSARGDDAGRPRRRERGGEGAGLEQGRAVFMISVAAELAEMHPQTLRMYEARGLITPKRSAKNTRLYSLADVERLRRIQRMTADDGLNLAGVETVLGLEAELERARVELGRMRRRASEIERQMLAEIERVKRSFRAEIVPYGAYESLPPAGGTAEARAVRIRVERGRRQSGEGAGAG